MQQSQLAQLCIVDNRVRENYYSDTYRCTFSLNGLLQPWDITHISIPFAPEKERSFMERFGIRKEALTGYYERLAERLPYEAKLLDMIHERGGDFEQLAGNLVRFLYIESIPKEGRGSDIYYVTEPLDALVGSDFIHHDVVSMLNLLQLGARFTQMLKVMLGTGLHVGAFDLDTIYLTKPESGRPMIKLGSLLYASLDGEPLLPPLESMPPSTGEDVRQGARPSVSTDMDALCGMLWTLANGNHYTMPPDYEIAPQYAPDELIKALVQALEAEATEGEEALKELHNTLFRMIRQIRKGEMSDLVIPLEPPVYPGLPPEELLSSEAETVTDIPETESAKAQPDLDPNAPNVQLPQGSPDMYDSGANPLDSQQPEKEPETDCPGTAGTRLSNDPGAETESETKEGETDDASVCMGSFVLEDLETVELPDDTEVTIQKAGRETGGNKSVLPALLYLMMALLLFLLVLEFSRIIEPFEIPLIHEFTEAIRELLVE